MRRREFLYAAGGGLAAASISPALLRAFAKGAVSAPADTSQRGLLIVLPSQAPPQVAEIAQKVFNAAGSHPLMREMAGPAGAGGKIVDYQRLLQSDITALAYNHLILIGTPDADPVQSAWQREATVGFGGNPDDIYIFGYGHLRGAVGYIESDRNPFLHAANIPFAPYETQVVTLSGTSTAGIAAATDAFLEHSLVNGVVGTAGWSRPERTLLDRDPLVHGFALPTLAPETMNGMKRIAVTQASEDEYRGVLADTGVEPAAIWRYKYYATNGWDIARSAGAFDAYAAGLHRRSYGNTLWLARFADAGSALAAHPKIALAAKIRQSGAQSSLSAVGNQPAYAGGYPGEHPTTGPLTLTQQGEWLIMKTF